VSVDVRVIVYEWCMGVERAECALVVVYEGVVMAVFFKFPFPSICVCSFSIIRIQYFVSSRALLYVRNIMYLCH